MPRFFIAPSDITGKVIELAGAAARHSRALRLTKGESITACDGAGVDYQCRVADIHKERLTLEILGCGPSENEPSLKITLFQALPKGDKMDFIVQKCVELGVSEIIPVETSRCVSRINDKSAAKAERWQRVSLSAAEQCGRGVVPAVGEPFPFAQAIKKAAALDVCFAAYEGEKAEALYNRFCGTLRSANAVRSAGVFIGPEGGFAQEEIALLTEDGISPVSLGRRVYRTETAGFVAVLILLLAGGEL